jgi:hypothetical protein
VDCCLHAGCLGDGCTGQECQGAQGDAVGSHGVELSSSSSEHMNIISNGDSSRCVHFERTHLTNRAFKQVVVCKEPRDLDATATCTVLYTSPHARVRGCTYTYIVLRVQDDVSSKCLPENESSSCWCRGEFAYK